MSHEENIYTELEDCVEEIHYLIAENKNDMHFLKEVLFQVREMENRILFHRRLYFKPQPKTVSTEET